jgi:hypothetical protein
MAEEVGFDAVFAWLGELERELLGPVAAGRVARDCADLVRRVVAVAGFATCEAIEAETPRERIRGEKIGGNETQT